MSKIIDFLVRLFKLIIHPIRCIKGVDILMFNTKICKLLIMIVLAIGMIYFSYVIYNNVFITLIYSPVLIVISGIVALIRIYTTSGFYTVILNFRKNEKISNEIMQKIVTPFILLSTIFSVLVGLGKDMLPFLVYCLRVLISAWFSTQMFLIFKHKFKENRRGIVAMLTGFVFSVILNFFYGL